MPKKGVRRFVTVAIIPHTGQAPISLCLPQSALQFLPILFAIILAALVTVSAAYFASQARLLYATRQLDLQAAAYSQLEEAYVQGQSRYETLAGQARAIEERLAQLAMESSEIRQLLALADRPPSSVPPGRPGSAEEDPAVGRGGPAGRAEVLRSVAATLQNAEQDLKLYDNDLRALRASTLEFVRRRAHTPSIWPTEGWVSSGFGNRRHPVTGEPNFHEGIDIAGITGTPVRATADGVVVVARRWGSFGLTVVIDHEYGLRTLYGHLSRILVKPGQRVSKGQEIGRMGSTGLSTGPHLHYEVHLNGRPVNPLRYLP